MPEQSSVVSSNAGQRLVQAPADVTPWPHVSRIVLADGLLYIGASQTLPVFCHDFFFAFNMMLIIFLSCDTEI
tara:strand:+ start:4295 stop:4513 length:219 start_codon:yes stop_codon:yes gene_type:complete